MPAPSRPTPPDSRWRRIGVLGGTVDPPHVGHLVAAVDTRHALDLDVVLLVVANDPWQKRGVRAVSPAADRLALVRAAVLGVDGVEASDIEIQRGGTTYTADTLAELARGHPGAELVLVLGSDAAAGLPTWERVEDVRRLASLAVVVRPGAEAGGPPPGWSWTTVATPRLDVSSTDLRARVAAGAPIDFLVPAPVAAAIVERGLYR